MKLVSTTAPRMKTPRPAWASAMPQAPSGRPLARRRVSGKGARKALVRTPSSASAPQISHAPTPSPAAASAFFGSNRKKAAKAAAIARAAASHRRCKAPFRSPRFHASNGPAGRTRQATIISGLKTALK